MKYIYPDWPAPGQVQALSTLRAEGVSVGVYQGLNLGDHVGDSMVDVAENRALLRDDLPSEPCWLQQVHGTTVAYADNLHERVAADASVANHTDVVCAVLTADCLPVLFCAQDGSVVGAAHAGWRGLLAGVLEETVAAMAHPAEQIMAWMGPAIGPNAFEVGSEVRTAFVADMPSAASAFQGAGSNKWLADIYALARLRLKQMGITQIYGGEFCTYGDAERFYSYRRDGVTGRMASLIWISDARAA
ncbi:peptidoglycan editing factor PgeF [Sulfuriferula nivalis]|uniref:Purine nucleoside phosphorylase n=1 Tax=Sulfuriferula nivalis TaxID=2675298 RepID=A0A809S9Z7_9PROT|nr:peptidoglycan editing factor PgeF [Sulfuriferula nivalis]BBP01252.1 laccase domain protein [Sulfuriferula nivalis]